MCFARRTREGQHQFRTWQGGESGGTTRNDAEPRDPATEIVGMSDGMAVLRLRLRTCRVVQRLRLTYQRGMATMAKMAVPSSIHSSARAKLSTTS
ncbi:hypothetical protein JSE7799_02506 [Jannaschia seosinensis]|uniref:Uncharacterized protein n=1 Tax=Jannaschia seosinensis TaxID=313367 RepID=A0A0M7BCH8_9RHOB|nr:hypothetical protein JSE7799_02506 [Jannaschia seosinensis]